MTGKNWDIFIDGPKDRFLYDYLSNLENFSNVLFDEKVLMSTEYGGPPKLERYSKLSTPTF